MELADDCSEVSADRHVRYEEPSADLSCPEAIVQQLEHLPLPGRETGATRQACPDAPVLVSGPVLFGKPLDKYGREGSLTRKHHAKDPGNFGRVMALEHVARRSGGECCQQIIVLRRDREHHDRDPWLLGSDHLGGTYATPGHADIKESDIGPCPARRIDRFVGVGDVGAHEKAPELDRSTHQGPGRGMVIGNENARSPHYGHNTSTVVPRPGEDRTSSDAPIASARSFMLTSPSPNLTV